MPNDNKTRTNKPVSLHPLDPEQALKALLEVKPPPEARSEKTRKSVKSTKREKKKSASKSG